MQQPDRALEVLADEDAEKPWRVNGCRLEEGGRLDTIYHTQRKACFKGDNSSRAPKTWPC